MDNNLKVLHIIPTLAKGGAERITLDICKELKIQGHDVKLLVLYNVNDYGFMTDELDVTFLNLKFKFSIKGKNHGSVKEVEEFIYKFQPDIIHSHLFESEIVLSQITYNRAKYIVHFHDNMPQFVKWDGKWSKNDIIHYLVRKHVLKEYKKKDVSFIAISNDTLHYIHINLPKHRKSYLLLNSIDRERFEFKESIDRKPLSLLMIGSLVDKKNQQLAIKVVNWLHLNGYQFTLDLLGDGPNKEILQSLIDTLKLNKFITLHGNVDFPEEFLKTRQFYIHTATYEPFGLVLLEAMTSKIPIISVDGHGNRDLIKNNFNGIIEKDFSEKVIGEHILELLKNQNLTQTMVENAYHFSESFSIQSYVLKLIEIYSRT